MRRKIKMYIDNYPTHHLSSPEFICISNQPEKSIPKLPKYLQGSTIARCPKSEGKASVASPRLPRGKYKIIHMDKIKLHPK